MNYEFTTVLQVSKESLASPLAATGLSGNFMSGRVSYHLGLEGPSIAIDTACSSSLVSVHLSRLAYRCSDVRFAISAGVNLMLSPITTAAISQLQALSSDGRCKTFDSAANGYCRSEGICVLMLGGNTEDLIAYVSDTNSNQDGMSSGLTVPNGKSQIDLINRVFRSTDLSGITMHSFSTHGTGTALGDPIEIHSTVKAMEGLSVHATFHAIKSDVGHSEGAAGALGLCDSILRAQKLQIPPTKHLRYLNPYICEVINFIPSDKGYKGFSVSRQQMNVSGSLSTTTASFGMSGTNSIALIKQLDFIGPQRKTVSRLILQQQKYWPFQQVPLLCRYARHLYKQGTIYLELSYHLQSPRISQFQETALNGIMNISFGILLALAFEAIPFFQNSTASMIHKISMHKPLEHETKEVSLRVDSSGRMRIVENGLKLFEGCAAIQGNDRAFTRSKTVDKLQKLLNHIHSPTLVTAIAQIRSQWSHDEWQNLNLLTLGLDLNNLMNAKNQCSLGRHIPTLVQMAKTSTLQDFQICTGANSRNVLFYLSEDKCKRIQENEVRRQEQLRTAWLSFNLLDNKNLQTHQNLLFIRSQITNDRFKLESDIESNCLDSAWISSWLDLTETSELCFSSLIHFHALLLHSCTKSTNLMYLNMRDVVECSNKMHYGILQELYLAAVIYSSFKVCVLNIDSDIMDIQLHRFSPDIPMFNMLRSLALTLFVEHRERHLPTVEIMSLRKKGMCIRVSTLRKLHSCQGEYYLGLLNEKTYVYRLLSTRWKRKKSCLSMLPRGTFVIGANVSFIA
jgi:3-oxoacyl-(acyl-carrier-protein) synthase